MTVSRLIFAAVASTLLLPVTVMAQCINATLPVNTQSPGCVQTSGTVTITGSGSTTVTYQAGTSVTLLPGFDAKAGTATGAAFIASIGPVVTTTTLPAATVGVSYNATLSAQEGSSTGPFTWQPSTLGNGLTLSNTGGISGNPTLAGTLTFNAIAVDAAGNASLPQSLGITIAAPYTITTTTSTLSIPLGQSQPVTLTIARNSGFNGAVTLAAVSAPAGLSLIPATLSIAAGISTVSAVIAAGSGAQSGTFVIGATGASVAIPVTVQPQPNPVISLTSPANGQSVWGGFDVSGYALENTPQLSDPVSGIGIAVTANDGSGVVVNASATYPTSGVSRNDVCAAYPGVPNCPYIQFDYQWSTGQATGGTFLPNGSYTISATATDSLSPAASGTAQVTVTVDNQPPAPAILSPVYGQGLPGVTQQFQFNYLSPHSNSDFSYGQIVFAGPTTSCTVQWTLAGSVSLLSQANGAASPCTLATSGNSVSNSPANQAHVNVAIVFPSVMSGQVTVEAMGADEQGITGPLTTLTTFVVTGTAGPQILTSSGIAYLAAPGIATVTQTFVLVNGATGSVSLGTPSLFGSSPNSMLTGPPTVATNPSGLSGTVTYYPYVGSGDNLFVSDLISTFNAAGQLAFTVTGTTSAFPAITAPAAIYTAAQGTSITIPFTVDPQGYLGIMTVGANTPPGISASLPSPSGYNVNGANTFPVNLSLAISPTLPPATYAISLAGGMTDNGAYIPGSTPIQCPIFITVTAQTTPDFTIDTVQQESLAAGSGASFTAQVSPIGGFTGSVTLSSTQAALAPSLSFSPNTVTLDGTNQQTVAGSVAAATSLATCSYTLPFTATSGNISHTGSVAVNVTGGASAGFSVSTYSPISVQAGNASVAGVSVSLSGCFTGTPSYSLSGGLATAGMQAVGVGGVSVLTGPGTFGTAVSIDVPAGTAAGSYTGQLNVTMAGVTHSTPLTVNVAQVSPPYYTLSSAYLGGTPPNIPQNGIGKAFVILNGYNNYTGVPALSALTLPTGISVTFSNNGLETYGSVTANISAASSAALGSGTIWIQGYDGSSAFTTSIAYTVTAPTLSAISSVMYSRADPNTHLAGNATIAVAIFGGLPPFTTVFATPNTAQTCSAATNCTTPTFGMSAPWSATTVNVTVSDSSATPQTVSLTVNVPAPPQLPEQLLHAAVLLHMGALNDFAAHIAAEGEDNTYISTLIPAQSGMTEAQYNALLTQASSFRNAVANLNSSHNSYIALLHKAGQDAANANNVYSSQLQSNAATASALPSTYLGILQNDPAGYFSLLDSWAWRYAAPQLEWGTGSEGIGYLSVSAMITLNQGPGAPEMEGDASVVISGFDSSQPANWDALTTLNVSMTGTNGYEGGSESYETDATLFGPANQSGTYTITAGGDGEIDDSEDGFYWYRQGYSRASTGYTAPACTAPQITGVEIYPNYGSVPQPTSGLLLGSVGNLQVNATCLDDSAQLSVDGSGVTLTPFSNGGASVTYSYSVDSGASVGSRNLTLVTTSNGGSAGTTLEVVPSLPYIDTITPNQWLAGQSTSITIIGAGFGGGGAGASPGTVSFGSQFPITWVPTAWSDGRITGMVTPSSADPGEEVTISITGGTYGSGFISNSGAGEASPAVQAAVTTGPSASISRTGSVTTISGNDSSHAVLVSVGEQVQLTGSVANLPAGVSITKRSWMLTGTVVSGYSQTLTPGTVPVTSATVTNFTDPGTDGVSFYWIDSDNTTLYSAVYTATLSSGSPVTATVLFQVAKPTNITFTGTTTTMTPAVNVGNYQFFRGNVTSLNFGYNPDFQNGSPGITFQMGATTGYGGSFALLQLISITNSFTLTGGGSRSENSGGYVLDTTTSNSVPQYNSVDGIVSIPPGRSAEWPLVDAPSIALMAQYSAVTANEAFRTYFTYKPATANAIWVTLAVLNWNWAGTTASVGGSWAQATATSFSAHPASASTNLLPAWSSNVLAVVPQ